MKKLRHFFIGFVGFCFFIFSLIVLALVFGFLPFTKKGIKNYSTNIFATSVLDSNSLKIARYDVEFIASFTSGAKRYVALYPFIVEAEIDLSRARKNSKLEILSLPYPEFKTRLDTNNIQIFTSTITLDYTKVLQPVLEMFREKSRDYALQDETFVSQVVLKAQEYLDSIFGPAQIEWENNPDPVRYENLPNIPLGIQTSTSALVSLESPVSLRDAVEFKLARNDPLGISQLRLGIAGVETGTIDDFVKKFDTSNRLMFRFHSPQDPKNASFVSFADEGYHSAFIFARGGSHYYYLEDTKKLVKENEEEYLRIGAPNLLYTAASLKAVNNDELLSDQKAVSDTAWYREYVDCYNEALTEARFKRYGKKLFNALSALDVLALSKTNENSPEVALIKDLAGWSNKNVFVKKTNSHKIAKLSSLLSLPDFKRMDSLFRVETETRFRNQSDIMHNLELFFWLFRDELELSESEIGQYKEDIINSGSVVNKKIVAELTDKERNTLFSRFITQRFSDSSVFETLTDEANNSTWIFYGKPVLEWKAKKSLLIIRKQLVDRGLQDDRLILLFSDSIDKARFFTNYFALVFDSEKIMLFEGLSNIFKPSPKEAAYSEILCIDGSCSIAGRSILNKPELSAILNEFSLAWTSELYNTDRVIELINEDFHKEVISSLSRPQR